MIRCRVKDVPIPHKNVFIVRPVLAVRPSSVTDNLRGGYIILGHNYEKGLTAESHLTIKTFLYGIGTSFTLHLIR